MNVTMNTETILPRFPPACGLLRDEEDVMEVMRSPAVAKINHYVLGPEGTNISQAARYYFDTTSIKNLLGGDSWLVTHMDGKPLEFKRGQPVRLMTLDLYQFKGVKAVSSLEVVDNYEKGTWASVGYTDATIQPYPHKAIDTGEDLMPEDHLIELFKESLVHGESK